MRIETDIKLDFKDVLIRPKRSTLKSRKEVDVTRDFKFKHSRQSYTGFPIIAANMDTVGTMEMAKAFHNMHNGATVALHKHYSYDDLVLYYTTWGGNDVWYSLGITDSDLEKLQRIKASQPGKLGHVNRLCIDVANGYTESFVDFVKKVRNLYPDDVIMAGNVVTGEMVEELILSGADVVKVGIGPGSVCTTRKMTGVGYPQLSAIIECADAAHGLGGLVCADGGCTVPGDLAKAFGAGADFIMLGGMLAGHKECAGEITNTQKKIKSNYIVDGEFINNQAMIIVRDTITGQNHVYTSFQEIPSDCYEDSPTEASTMKFYGMSSDTAMNKHNGGVASYRASEGKTVEIPYRGPVAPTMQDIMGGVRSACSYIGSRNLKEMSKRTTFVQVTQQLNNIFGGS